jgi:hypothetical protein
MTADTHSAGKPLHKPHSHGNTPAAWTCVGIMIVGALVCAIAFPLVAPWLFFVGLGIIVVGLVVGKVMALAGLGALPSYNVEEPYPTKFEGATMTDEEQGDA